MDIFKKLFKGNILYYPGCAAKFAAPFLIEKYENILRKIGIDFIKLTDLEFCCGSPAKNAGYEKDFLEVALKNLKIFEDHSISKIITNCPACFKVFAQDYKESLGDKWNIEAEHIVITLIKAIKAKKISLKNLNLTVTFHDPCHLGKQMKIFDEPREILKAAGITVKEMKLNKENSFCCGGGGGLKSNFPELSGHIAKERMEMAKETGANILVTPCPMCYLNMKENAEGVDVREFGELLDM